MSPAVTFENVTLGYERHPAVHHITGQVGQGELLAVVGPNGAGKSTLLKGITGELRVLDGMLALDPSLKGRMAYLPQVSAIDRSFPMDVLDFVASGLWRRTGACSALGSGLLADVQRALEAVGLTGFERRLLSTLSGGQFQRALFARLMLQDAQLILLDEPFTAIDSRTTAHLIGLIEGWHRDGRTVLAVVHDFDLVRRVFPSTLLLAREVVAWGATSDVLTAEHLAHATGMIEAFDDHAAHCHRAA